MELDTGFLAREACVCVCVYIYTFLYNGAFQSLSRELVSGKAVSMNTGSPRVLERQQKL